MTGTLACQVILNAGSGDLSNDSLALTAAGDGSGLAGGSTAALMASEISVAGLTSERVFDMVGVFPSRGSGSHRDRRRVREEEPMAEPIEASSPSARVATLMEQPHGDLSDAAEQLAALVAAATAELLEVICAIDRKESWRDDGATSTTAWVVAMLRVSHTTAREWVRVGRSLDALPHVRQAYSEGMLSWDQVRHATIFVTPAEDEEAARELPGFTAAQLEERAKFHGRRTPRDAEGSKLDRSFTWRRDRDRDGWRYQGFLTAEEGGILNAALEQRAQRIGKDPGCCYRLPSVVCLTGRPLPTSIRMHRVLSPESRRTGRSRSSTPRASTPRVASRSSPTRSSTSLPSRSSSRPRASEPSCWTAGSESVTPSAGGSRS